LQLKKAKIQKKFSGSLNFLPIKLALAVLTIEGWLGTAKKGWD
jgi:hypothetical protein